MYQKIITSNKKIEVLIVGIILIITPMFSYGLSLDNEVTFESMVKNHHDVIIGHVQKIEIIPQLCTNIAITKYSVLISDSSNKYLKGQLKDIITFGGRLANGDTVYINKNYLLNKNENIVMFVNSTIQDTIYIHDHAFGMLNIKNDLVSIPWFDEDTSEKKVSSNSLVEKFNIINSKIDSKKSNSESENYYTKASNGLIDCINSTSSFQKTNSIKDEKPSQEMNDSERAYQKYTIWHPGYTARRYITGPASDNSMFDTLTNAAYEAWNFKFNLDHSDNDLVPVLPGNNSWQFGGLIPRNEWAGWPTNSTLSDQGLPPWESNTLGIAFPKITNLGKEVDIALNPAYSWTWKKWSALLYTSTAKSVYSTLGHELGHLLNLHHPFEYYNTDHHSIMNYPIRSCRRNLIGVDDYLPFAGLTSIISPPLELDSWHVSVFPCAARNRSNSMHADYIDLTINPSVVDCQTTFCGFGFEIDGGINGFTKQNFGTDLATSDNLLSFSFHPYGPRGQWNDENDNNITTTISTQPLESLSSYPVTDPIQINYKIPQTNEWVPNDFSNLFNYSIIQTGGLLWPTISSYDARVAEFGKNPIYIRGFDESNQGSNIFLFEHSPKDYYLPIGGGMNISIPYFFIGGGDKYIEISAPENVELTIRQYDFTGVSRDFRICGGTNSSILRVQLDPFEVINGRNNFTIFYADFDQVNLLNTAVNVPLGQLKYGEGVAPPNINTISSFYTSQDTIFANNFSPQRNNNCKLDTDVRHTFSVYSLGRPYGEFSN